MRRTHFEHQFAERRDRITLDIELGRQHFLQVAHVRITDMAGVGTGMHRNPLRSKRSQSSAARTTSGRLPPRELRTTAILLMFTLSFVIKTLFTQNDRQSVKLYPQIRTVARSFRYLRTQWMHRDNLRVQILTIARLSLSL